MFVQSFIQQTRIMPVIVQVLLSELCNSNLQNRERLSFQKSHSQGRRQTVNKQLHIEYIAWWRVLWRKRNEHRVKAWSYYFKETVCETD